LLVAARATAVEPTTGPLIRNYGANYPVTNRDIPLREGFIYRAVFDAASYSGAISSLNMELDNVARFLNMHARAGVAREQFDIAVVLHGDALKSALSHSAYEARFHAGNPSLDLLMQLHEAGVRFYACGQSMEFLGYASDELASPVKVALSAMTVLVGLQADGYALLP
jgi:intracellular sulfur oxidation DsrE/DsrF family protein